MTEPTRPVIRPGDLLNVYDYQEIRHEFAAGAGLRPDQVLMTPYGYPPLPRPPVGAPDGTGRPARQPGAGVRRPSGVLARRRHQAPAAGRADDAFAIRLFLELVDRGYLREDDGWLRNPLVAHGLDVRKQSDRDRLCATRAASGTPCCATWPSRPTPRPSPGPSPAAPSRSTRSTPPPTRSSSPCTATWCGPPWPTPATRCGRPTSPPSRSAWWRRARSCGPPPGGADARPSRAALDDAYRWLLARMAQIDDARTVLLVEIDRRTNLDAPRGAASYADDVRLAHGARCAALEPYMAAVYPAPPTSCASGPCCSLAPATRPWPPADTLTTRPWPPGRIIPARRADPRRGGGTPPEGGNPVAAFDPGDGYGGSARQEAPSCPDRSSPGWPGPTPTAPATSATSPASACPRTSGRWARMAGHDVLMVSGTDEHGTPITVEAEAEG